jgi:hypothetical protein
MNYLRPLKHWDRGFESHSSHDGCLCAVLCEVAALQRADTPSKESYRLCKKDEETEKRQRSNKGL